MCSNLFLFCFVFSFEVFTFQVLQCVIYKLRTLFYYKITNHNKRHSDKALCYSLFSKNSGIYDFWGWMDGCYKLCNFFKKGTFKTVTKPNIFFPLSDMFFSFFIYLFFINKTLSWHLLVKVLLWRHSNSLSTEPMSWQILRYPREQIGSKHGASICTYCRMLYV